LDQAVESAWWHSYEAVPGTAITMERLPYASQPSEELKLQFSLQEGFGYTVGYTVERGQGRVTVIGLQPTPALILALHRSFGVTAACRSRVSGVSSGLFRRGDDYYLVATNDGSESKATLFDLALPAGRWQAHNLETGEMIGTTSGNGGTLPVMIGRKDGVALRLTLANERD
jgi:hypothetical protein